MTDQLALFTANHAPLVPTVEPAPPAPKPAPLPVLAVGQRVRIDDGALLFPGHLGEVASVSDFAIAVAIDGYPGPPHPRYIPERLTPVGSEVVKEWRWWPDLGQWLYTGHMGLAATAVCLHPDSQLFPVGIDPNEQ